MKYSELIQFEPIESVVELKGASQSDYAFKLLESYVISDRMAEVIDETIIEQLQYDYPADNKGLLVVGNYGTGKSHLMSVISTIAEMYGASERVSNERVARRASVIEGKFKVLRTEMSGVTLPFRNILFQDIADYMTDIGVDYILPDVDSIRSNKDELVKIMAAFNEVYPNQGFLLVVDELLDYLRGRKEQELILDLGFLRELGEICRTTRFRFIAGVQEMLFDNPKFQFVAEQLRRVRERFEQVSIVREDVEYVVSHRLLKKSDKQKALIREHLQKFTPLYTKLSEKLEQYVDLFPIHPSYLSAFERVSVAEKRVILKTISREMSKLLDKEVPNNQPGLISYDSYWPYIENDKGLKTNPDVKEVMSKAKILQDRIENAFTRPVYRPMALRIVRALSVFRLTTDDIYAKVGVTAEELRDQLFLYIDLPEQEAEFLRSTVETVLREILKTVSWQYISTNEENGQYYLDLNKDVPVDDLIEQKAEGLGSDELNRYYFIALEQVAECSKTTYITGYRIWQQELTWLERKVSRPGYLFFGAPNERSTAQPERDFYLYMIQPFDSPKYKDDQNPDEVFFKLAHKDDKFLRYLRLYAGAREMSATASSATKKLYEDRANDNLRLLTQWLRENMYTVYTVTYKGITRELSEWRMFAPSQASVREIIDAAATDCLNSWFAEKYPDYPTFKKLNTPMTTESMNGYIQDALRNISVPKTRSSIAILDGLVLLENDRLSIRRSGYAKWVLEKLESKAQGQVVNQSELIETVQIVQGTSEVKKTIEFKIEPELFTVVLAALVYTGDIVITINGQTYGAMKFEQLIKLPLHEFAEFDYIKKPSGLPLPALNALFDLFGLSHGLLNQNAIQNGIAEMIKIAGSLLNRAVSLMNEVKDGFPIGESVVLSSSEIEQYRKQLDTFKQFLEGTQVYNTPAKLHNFKYTIDEIHAQETSLEALKHLEELKKRISEISKEVNYIGHAQHHLPMDHPWQQDVEVALGNLLHALKNGQSCQSELQEIQRIKEEYQKFYIDIHSKSRLNATGDNKKASLYNDKRFTALRLLSTIDLLTTQQLDKWQKRISLLKTCWSLTKADLEQQPICPHCKLRPKDEPFVQHVKLDELEDELQDLFDNWTHLILTNLIEPEVKENITLLKLEQQQLINELLETKEFVLPIDVKLIQTIKELLQGIERVEITMDKLARMMGNGSPLTLDELRYRFEQLIREEIGIQPTNRVRVVLGQK